MSRVGKLPIKIPEGVEVKVEHNLITIAGQKGRIQQSLHPDIKVQTEDGWIKVIRPSDNKLHKSLHGLYRTLINNMVEGVTRGFQKRLEIVGVGYRAELRGKRLVLQIGFSQPIVFVPPDEIQFAVENPNSITVKGIDKQLVGQVAAKIRSFRPPEPYKGKGIRYEGEYVKAKAGKTAASGG